MQYALLIYTDETADANASKQEQDASMAGYYAFGEQFKEQIAVGEALVATNTATTVRVRDGRAAWRLLSRQRQRPRRGDSDRVEYPLREVWLHRGAAGHGL